MRRTKHPKAINLLLAEMRKTARITGLSVARLSTLVLGGGREIERIKAGGEIGARKLERVTRDLERLQRQSCKGGDE